MADHIWADREWAEEFVKLEKQLLKLEEDSSKQDLDVTNLEYETLNEDLGDQFQEMNQETRNLVDYLRNNTEG